MSGKPAARLGDPTACPIPGHGTNPIAAGSPNVLLDGLPAARQGDASACGGALSGNVIPTVLINGKPATTIGTVGNHGNVVMAGSGTVLIGASGGGASFVSPSPVDIKGIFDEFFVLLDQDSGAPLSGIPYVLRSASGKEIHGITGTDGKTEKLSSSSAETIELVIPKQSEVVIA
ncbi:MAG TPA: PAAR domain-containing protein [Pseudomonas sp.]|nr:PAAR domain-containing protein [Pseudomonas sp.]